MMDMAKADINTVVQSIMKSNKIPPDIMVYILESVLYEVERMRGIVEAGRNIKVQESKKDGEK